MVSYAVVFDIDGVLMKDSVAIPGASEALASLEARGVPTIFVSNGGGRTEETRAAQLSRVLGTPVAPEQMVLPHTPMRALAAAATAPDALPVLCVGRGATAAVARSLGLHRVALLGDVAAARPFLFPQKRYSAERTAAARALPPAAVARDGVSAVFVLEEPEDWGEALQVVVDVLRCAHGRLPLAPDEAPVPVCAGAGAAQSVPVYVANPDFVYGGEFAFVRYTVGAFVRCLALLYRELLGAELACTFYGKPEPTTYAWARTVLARELERRAPQAHDRGHAQAQLRTVYAIGDNPRSDVRGARNAAAADPAVRWVPVLTRTGCFQGAPGTNDPDDPADIVVSDVAEAVATIIRLEDEKARA